MGQDILIGEKAFPSKGAILGKSGSRGVLDLDPRTLMGVLVAVSALAFIGKGVAGAHQSDCLPPELLGELPGALRVPHGASLPRRALRLSSGCPNKYSHISHISPTNRPAKRGCDEPGETTATPRLEADSGDSHAARCPHGRPDPRPTAPLPMARPNPR